MRCVEKEILWSGNNDIHMLLLIIYSFPGADDTTLFTKFQRQHKGHTHYQSPQRKLDDPVFTIVHYAGPVVYHIHVSYIIVY